MRVQILHIVTNSFLDRAILVLGGNLTLEHGALHRSSGVLGSPGANARTGIHTQQQEFLLCSSHDQRNRVILSMLQLSLGEFLRNFYASYAFLCIQ